MSSFASTTMHADSLTMTTDEVNLIIKTGGNPSIHLEDSRVVPITSRRWRRDDQKKRDVYDFALLAKQPFR